MTVMVADAQACSWQGFPFNIVDLTLCDWQRAPNKVPEPGHFQNRQNSWQVMTLWVSYPHLQNQGHSKLKFINQLISS